MNDPIRTPEPRVGIGAAILDDKDRLLLIKRKTDPEAEAWGLPGGKVDYGERAEQAVVREIREELGVEITLTGLSCITETIDLDNGCHWLAPVYTARIVSGDPRIMEPDKHAAWDWFDPASLPADLTTPTRDYLRHRVASRSY